MFRQKYNTPANSDSRSKTGGAREFYKCYKSDTKYSSKRIHEVAPKREMAESPIRMSEYTRNNLSNKFKRSLQNGGLSRIIKNIEIGVKNAN
jgi:hypothetical protein